MRADKQLDLWRLRFGEPKEDECRFEPEQILDQINSSRRTIAVETKFFDVRDYFDETDFLGGETEVTLRDDMIDLYIDQRDCAVYDGVPLTIKPFAEWASITQRTNWIIGVERFGMKHGHTFFLHPAAEAGKTLELWGYGTPPDLATIDSVDVHLTSEQAELTILDSVIQAKADAGEPVSRVTVDKYNALKRRLMKVKIPGVRLENVPEDGKF